MGFGLCVVVLVLVLHAVRLLLILFQLAFRPREGFGLAVDWLRAVIFVAVLKFLLSILELARFASVCSLNLDLVLLRL